VTQQANEDLDAALAVWAASARAYGLRRAKALHDRIDPDNIDQSFAAIAPALTYLYAQLGVWALSTVDEYWRIKMALNGYRADFDWRESRFREPIELPSGQLARPFFDRAPRVAKARIREGVKPKQALRSSYVRSARVVGTVTHLRVRESIMGRSYAIDMGKRLSSPLPAASLPARQPITLPSVGIPANMPTPLVPFAREVVTLEPLESAKAPAVPSRAAVSAARSDDIEPVDTEPLVQTAGPSWAQGPRVVYRRVPSVGACAFCLTLASRGAVYTQDTVLRRADGGGYHENCRCTAAAEIRGVSGFVLSRPDYERLQETYRRDGTRAVAGAPRQFGIATTHFGTRYENFYTLDGYRDEIYVYEPNAFGKPPMANWDRAALTKVRDALPR
jgi:hypothetical protein